MPLVDSHVHLFTRDLPLASDAWMAPAEDLPVERFEQLMSRHGVTHAVISAMSLLGGRTDYTVAALRRNPRLRATVIVDPETGPARLARMRDDGVVGVRLQWRRRAELPDLDGPPYRSFLRRVAELGWHVELNVERERMAPVLDRLCRGGTEVVVDHYGDPDPTLGYRTPGGRALMRALGTGRVRVKVSAGYRFRVDAEVLAGYAAVLVAEAGADRVFWGSDAPFVGAAAPMTYAAALAERARVLPDAAVRDQVDAAAHTYYFGSRAPAV